MRTSQNRLQWRAPSINKRGGKPVAETRLCEVERRIRAAPLKTSGRERLPPTFNQLETGNFELWTKKLQSMDAISEA